MDKPIPKITIKMLEEVMIRTSNMYMLASQAKDESSEKMRDKMVNKIIDLHDEIDDLVTSNWH